MCDSSRQLGEVAEHLIGGSKKRICRLSFEFYSPHVVKRRSNFNMAEMLLCIKWGVNEICVFVLLSVCIFVCT